VAAVITFLFTWNEYTMRWCGDGSTANTLPTAISASCSWLPRTEHLAASVNHHRASALVAYFLQRHVGNMNLVDAVR